MKESFDWLITREWGKPIDRLEVCILTTRGDILARHIRQHIRDQLDPAKDAAHGKIPGLRRYLSQAGAHRKCLQLNKKYRTKGYRCTREDKI